MLKLGKVGASAVLGLLLGLVMFTTGAFAQNVAQKNVDRSNISVLAHAATTTDIMQGMAGAAQKNGGCIGGGCRRGFGFNGCRGFGGCSGFNGCRGFSGCGSHFRRMTQIESRTRIIRECRGGFWGRACRSIRVTEKRIVTRTSFRNSNNFGNSGNFGNFGNFGNSNSWAVGVGVRH